MFYKCLYNNNYTINNYIFLLFRVQKNEDTDLSISTIVLQVIAKDSKGEAYFPYDPSHMQNIGFLLIDSVTHEITTFLHQFGEYCLSQ